MELIFNNDDVESGEYKILYVIIKKN